LTLVERSKKIRGRLTLGDGPLLSVSVLNCYRLLCMALSDSRLKLGDCDHDCALVTAGLDCLYSAVNRHGDLIAFRGYDTNAPSAILRLLRLVVLSTTHMRPDAMLLLVAAAASNAVKGIINIAAILMAAKVLMNFF
jgi:hypothetical protein